MRLALFASSQDRGGRGTSDAAQLRQEAQIVATEKANAVRKHDQAVRAAQAGRSPARRRWGQPA